MAEGAVPGKTEVGVSDFGLSAAQAVPDTGPENPPDPRFALADSARDLIRLLVAGKLPDDAVTKATEDLSRLVETLSETKEPGRRARPQPRPDGHPRDFFPTSPVIGFANPLSPPVEITVVDGEVRGRVTFGYPYEGPPTCVHGGVIAMVFDELLGAANIVGGYPGMTGTLTVRYLKPTPLRTELRIVARCEGKEGRKIRTKGWIYAGDVVTAEAEGIFIEMVPERFLAITASHTESPEALAEVMAEADRIGVTRVPSSHEALPPDAGQRPAGGGGG
jgi:acyl-coenzyme A thioesterase PaaI-like protein